MSHLIAKEITSEEGFAYLGKPFNAPVFSESYTEDDFRDEWYDAREGLETLMSEFGEHDAYADGDFYIGEDYGDSRGIGIEINTPEILTPQLFASVQSYLASLPYPYSLHFFLDLGLNNRIIVRRDAIRYFALDPELAIQCGFR